MLTSYFKMICQSNSWSDCSIRGVPPSENVDYNKSYVARSTTELVWSIFNTFHLQFVIGRNMTCATLYLHIKKRKVKTTWVAADDSSSSSKSTTGLASSESPTTLAVYRNSDTWKCTHLTSRKWNNWPVEYSLLKKSDSSCE